MNSRLSAAIAFRWFKIYMWRQPVLRLSGSISLPHRRICLDHNNNTQQANRPTRAASNNKKMIKRQTLNMQCTPYRVALFGFVWIFFFSFSSFFFSNVISAYFPCCLFGVCFLFHLLSFYWLFCVYSCISHHRNQTRLLMGVWNISCLTETTIVWHRMGKTNIHLYVLFACIFVILFTTNPTSWTANRRMCFGCRPGVSKRVSARARFQCARGARRCSRR